LTPNHNTKGRRGGGIRARNTPRSKKGDSVGQYFGDAWSLAKRTANGLNEIRKLINIEEKIQAGTVSSTPDRTGNVYPLTQMAQGIDYANNRVGDSIKLQTIQFRAKVLLNGSATGTACRVLVVRDLFNIGGGDPTTAQILQDVASTFAPLSPMNWLLRDRFSVLCDETFDLSSGGNQCATFYWNVAHEGHVKYVGTTAAAASNGPGSLYLVAISDEATNTPALSVDFRVTFTDD